MHTPTMCAFVHANHLRVCVGGWCAHLHKCQPCTQLCNLHNGANRPSLPTFLSHQRSIWQVHISVHEKRQSSEKVFFCAKIIAYRFRANHGRSVGPKQGCISQLLQAACSHQYQYAQQRVCETHLFDRQKHGSAALDVSHSWLG